MHRKKTKTLQKKKTIKLFYTLTLDITNVNKKTRFCAHDILLCEFSLQMCFHSMRIFSVVVVIVFARFSSCSMTPMSGGSYDSQETIIRSTEWFNECDYVSSVCVSLYLCLCYKILIWRMQICKMEPLTWTKYRSLIYFIRLKQCPIYSMQMFFFFVGRFCFRLRIYSLIMVLSCFLIFSFVLIFSFFYVFSFICVSLLKMGSGIFPRKKWQEKTMMILPRIYLFMVLVIEESFHKYFIVYIRWIKCGKFWR